MILTVISLFRRINFVSSAPKRLINLYANLFGVEDIIIHNNRSHIFRPMAGQQTLLNYFTTAVSSNQPSESQSLKNQKRSCKELETNNARLKKVKNGHIEAAAKPITEKRSNGVSDDDDEFRKARIIMSDDHGTTESGQPSITDSGLEDRPMKSLPECPLLDDRRSNMALGLKSEIRNSTSSTNVLTFERETNGLVNDLGKKSWFKALQAEFSKPYFIKLSRFIAEERTKHTIYPPRNEVFSWTKECEISKIKVVILGQDPYHNVGQAHGFAFSVQKGVALPPSLANIFKELQTDITGFVQPKHGDLTGWAKQGVLLLNAVLTVRAHQANSHKDKGWEQVTDAVIHYINANLANVVFILWGAHAQKKGAIITKSKHLVLEGPHPSPLSAHRGFFGCRHFSRANSYLSKYGRGSIDWSML